jgi:vancomycin permeability regulator SanA
MGFRKPIDYNAVSHQIYMSGVELNSPRNDGFVAFEIKKDLHRLKFLLDEILKDSPEFAGESEFLQEQSKKQMWRALNEM